MFKNLFSYFSKEETLNRKRDKVLSKKRELVLSISTSFSILSKSKLIEIPNFFDPKEDRLNRETNLDFFKNLASALVFDETESILANILNPDKTSMSPFWRLFKDHEFNNALGKFNKLSDLLSNSLNIDRQYVRSCLSLTLIWQSALFLFLSDIFANINIEYEYRDVLYTAT